MGLVACAVFKTVGRCLWRLWWVRFPHAPASIVCTLGMQAFRSQDERGGLWIDACV